MFERHPDREFDYFLAEKLGMLVADLRCRISGQEWLEWSVYYRRIEQRRELAKLAARNGGN